jgi:hypothetical protein
MGAITEYAAEGVHIDTIEQLNFYEFLTWLFFQVCFPSLKSIRLRSITFIVASSLNFPSSPEPLMSARSFFFIRDIPVIFRQDNKNIASRVSKWKATLLRFRTKLSKRESYVDPPGSTQSKPVLYQCLARYKKYVD